MIFFFALTGLFNGIGALALGLFVFFKKKKSALHRVFALLNMAIAVWALSYWQWLIASEKSVALFWTRILTIGSTFIPILFLHWILLVLNKEKEKKKLLILGYLMSAFFLLFSFSPLLVKGVEPSHNFPFWPIPGILYHFYIIFSYALLLGYGVYQLFMAYKQAEGYKKEQMKYIFLGLAIAAPAGFSNFPLWYKINFPPYLNILVLGYMACYAYAILKKKLLDIKIVLTQTLVALIAILLFINLVGAKTTIEYIWKGALFVSFLIFGWLLTKSVVKEIEQREQMNRLALRLKETNEKLENAYKKVKKLDKAKSEFIYIASHQLRTPLTAIKGYISMLLEGDYGKIQNQGQEKVVENVFSANERIIALVNSLLNLSRLESGKIKVNKEKVNLEELLEQLVKDFQEQAKNKNIGLSFEKPKEKIREIEIDREKIREVVSNLIDNALKYTPTGAIKVKLEKTRKKGKGEFALVKVTDTGEGMDKEEIAKLFYSFSRAKAGTKHWVSGTGLGLYIAKKFVLMHQGSIKAFSEGKGKGSTFLLELPL
ncbi:ATP-binding protein [Candidatus Parcubacteria bacterium]|nr:ATP-binding protein [Candidatus Parcubacteria bacterium]